MGLVLEFLRELAKTGTKNFYLNICGKLQKKEHRTAT